MPRIFDNIDSAFLPALNSTLEQSRRADFCVGYFNLRGWKSVHDAIDRFSEGEQFHSIVQKPIVDEIDKVLALLYGFTEEELDLIINYDIKYRMGKEL